MGDQIPRLEFNTQKDDYRGLITRLRATAQGTRRYSHNRPVLPIGGPVEWIDVFLTNGRESFTLRLRRDDLYLHGYQMKSPDAHDNGWREFGPNDGQNIHLIEGSTLLGFNGSYGNLLEGHPNQMVGREITHDSMAQAIEDLATGGQGNTRKKWLVDLILLICESTRYDAITEDFATNLHKHAKATVKRWMYELIRNWGNISYRLLLADASADKYFCLPEDSALRERIANALDAQRDIGILKGYPVSELLPRVKGEAPSDVSIGNVLLGQPMMDVITAKILDISTTLSGKITVADGLGSQVLFDGRQTLNAGDALSLNSLERAISACQSLEISYDLTAENQGLRFLGSGSWDIFQHNNNYYALQIEGDDDVEMPREGPKLLVAKGKRQVAKGKRQHKEYQGRITLSYQIFPMACQIGWKVKIVNGDGRNPVNTYGHLTASYSYGEHDYNFELFRRSDENKAEVCAGGYVPLTRNIMAVPLNTNLTVEVDLWDSTKVPRDHHLIGGSATHQIGRGLFENKVLGRFPFMKGKYVEICADWNLTSMD